MCHGCVCVWSGRRQVNEWMMAPVPPIYHVWFDPYLLISQVRNRKPIDIKCVTVAIGLRGRSGRKAETPGLVFFFFPLDHTVFQPSHSPWGCHTDFIFPVPPLASARLCIRKLATELICTMAKLVSHVIRTLGGRILGKEIADWFIIPESWKMPLGRGMARVDWEREGGRLLWQNIIREAAVDCHYFYRIEDAQIEVGDCGCTKYRVGKREPNVYWTVLGEVTWVLEGIWTMGSPKAWLCWNKVGPQ